MKNQKLMMIQALYNRQSPSNPLASQNAALKVRNEGDSATVYMYDVIDPVWGIGAQEFANTLAEIDGVKQVNLRINSPGGDVFDARTMTSAIHDLKARGIKVVSQIDGLAASAATYVALAADEVRANKGSFFMIHNAWTIAMGNANDLMDTAGLLEQIDSTIVHDYMKKTDIEESEIRDYMNAETWFEASDAMELGFIDAVDNEDASSPSDLVKAMGYKNIPKNIFKQTVTINVGEIDYDQEKILDEIENSMKNVGITGVDGPVGCDGVQKEPNSEWLAAKRKLAAIGCS